MNIHTHRIGRQKFTQFWCGNLLRSHYFDGWVGSGDNIKMDHREMGYEDVNRIGLLLSGGRSSPGWCEELLTATW